MDPLLRLPRVIEIVGLQKSALHEKIQKGQFPKPVKLSDDGRAVAWPSSEIASYIEKRKQERDERRTEPLAA